MMFSPRHIGADVRASVFARMSYFRYEYLVAWIGVENRCDHGILE
jgi:hypothetical protein